MTYKADCERHDAECKEAQRLYNIWQTTKKDEDKDIWWKALSSVHHRKYITITMTIWPSEDMDAEKLKEMIENNGVSLPWVDQNIYHGDQVVGEIVRGKVSIWPKPAI